MKDPLLFGEARSGRGTAQDRKSTRLNSSHITISYAVFCLKKKKHIANVAHAFLRCGCDRRLLPPRSHTRLIAQPRRRRCRLHHFVVELFFFFFNDTATTEIYTLSLHDALPI